MSTVKDVAIFSLSLVPTATLLAALNNTKMKGTEFAMHPTLALAGFSTILSGVYFTARATVKNKTIIYTHAAANTVGCALMVRSLQVMFRVKEKNGKPHLASVHGKLGALTVSLMVLQTAVGVYYALFPPALKERKETSKKHRQLGSLNVFLFALVTSAGALTSFGKNFPVKTVGVLSSLGAAYAVRYLA